jgi:hypothetical protein
MYTALVSIGMMTLDWRLIRHETLRNMSEGQEAVISSA